MIVLHILSADALLRPVLHGPPRPVEVHSVFRRTVNLAVGDDLVTVQIASLDDAPSSLRVGEPFWADVPIGAAGLMGTGHLVIGDASAHVTPRTAWWAPTRAAVTDAGRTRWPEALTRLEAMSAPGDPTPPVSGFDAALRAALLDRADALRLALSRADADGAATASTGLVGLGHGLTPSGDDVLTGCLLVLSMPGSGWSTPLALGDVAARTNTVAAAMLQQAGRGRFRQVLLDLTDALALGRDADRPARVVRDIGSSSGTDMLLGVRVGLAALLARR